MTTVRSKATGQLFEILDIEQIDNVLPNDQTLYKLRPIEPIVNQSYKDRYKWFGYICLTGSEVE